VRKRLRPFLCPSPLAGEGGTKCRVRGFDRKGSKPLRANLVAAFAIPPAYASLLPPHPSTADAAPASPSSGEGAPPYLANEAAIGDDVYVKQFESEEEFAAWLISRPASTAAIIAIRAALRVLPIAVSKSNPVIVSNSIYATRLMRAVCLSWLGLKNLASPGTPEPSREAIFATNRAANTVAGAISGRAGDARASIAHAAFAASNTHSLNVIEYSKGAARAAISACGDANTVWQNIRLDCKFTDDASGLIARNTIVGVTLLKSPLWPDRQPDWFAAEWRIAHETLQQIGQGFEIWRDWFQRRIDGEATGFDLPPDADAEISRRLIAADNGWWNRPPAEVNADIKAWLTELTPLPTEPDEADFTQNPRALTFGANAEGRIDLLPDMAGDRLLNNADAQDRHAEALAEAQAALAASSRDLSQAFAIGETLSDYLAALGDSVETIRPSQLVLRGDKLRRLRADYISPTSSKPPLTEDQAFALENWERAHSALVGIDPFLSSIERASYGPAVPATIITLDAIKAIIDSARDANIASVAAQTSITDSVENVPAEASAGERRLVLATESLKNFIRGTASFIRRHKGKISAGALGLAKGAHEAALWIQRNVEWLREALAGEQSILDLINWIASLPL
jgi:hypothetical protein